MVDLTEERLREILREEIGKLGLVTAQMMADVIRSIIVMTKDDKGESKP